MTDILNKLAQYLATKNSLEVGKEVFYNEVSDKPITAILLQELESTTIVPPQIDAAVHRIRISVRSSTNVLAKQLADSCYRWLIYSDDMLTPSDLEDEDTTGFIELDEDTTVYVVLYGNPIWDKVDQQGRKYYSFVARIITQKM